MILCWRCHIRLRLINCATAKLQKDCGTIHGCNYKYGSHGELKAYFRLVWTPNFIELVIKEKDANLKKETCKLKMGCLWVWVTWKTLFWFSHPRKSKTCSLLTTSSTFPGWKVLWERNFRRKKGKIHLGPAQFNGRRLSPPLKHHHHKLVSIT